MDEYIERAAAIEAVKHAWAKGLEPSQYIEALPAADVVPVVLPCKVGDTVWAIENPWTGELLKKPIEAYVNGMKKFSHGLYVNVLFDTRKINGTRDYEVNHIGKTLFLTCEEAEAALEAMKDGN